MFAKYLHAFTLAIYFILLIQTSTTNEVDEEHNNQELYKIEGKVFRPENSLVSDHEWFGHTKVVTNSGQVGFLK